MPYSVDEARCRDLEVSTRLEWMLPNGLGGFAMGTVSGINTRRYHGHLIAATRPPAERTLLLASIEASIQSEGPAIWISTNQYQGAIFPEGYSHLEAFELDQDAAWSYRAGRLSIEKRLKVHQSQNACTVEYRSTCEEPLLLTLRPLVGHRSYHGNFHEAPNYPEKLEFQKNKTVVEHRGVRLSLSHPCAQRLPVQGWYYRFEHAREFERGLDPREDLYCPCELRYELLPGEVAIFNASEGEGDKNHVAPFRGKRSEKTLPVEGLEGRLQQTALNFLVKTPTRTSIIAGYPWFTDWGRDTMISLPGICLSTGRIDDAKAILRDYSRQMRQGLIPNRFVEKGEFPEYNTADATLWFANAVHKTLEVKWDEGFACEMLDILEEVYDWHLLGTLYGIRVDPEDGLLTQGEPGVQLTWMDVKIDGWVVTPRHGKPIEINGLWVNTLRILQALSDRLNRKSDNYREAALKAEESFRRKFWCAGRGHYFDTVDPYDASLRPNQVIAMSLPFSPAIGDHALAALRIVEKELFTPVGLRTLGPNEPGYVGRFKGPLRELDAAYHQGTAWPWLLGPYVSALVRLTGDHKKAKRILSRATEMLEEYGLGGIAECYDADAPQRAGGCPWQAWSVAEILRAWKEISVKSERSETKPGTRRNLKNP